jgi:hypothetical protein
MTAVENIDVVNSKPEQVEASVELHRELARIVQIDEILVHPKADRMELAMIGGWQCCVKKDEFKAGDIALYAEIDAMLPTTIDEFAFLEARKDDLKAVGDKSYARIKTIKLRGEMSQGLLIPVPKMLGKRKVGENVTQALGVLKYEGKKQKLENVTQKNTWLDKLCRFISGPAPANPLLGWPSFINKTEEDRVQNRQAVYRQAAEAGELFEVTWKLNGSSMSAFHRTWPEDGSVHVGVCSRNDEISLVDMPWGFVEQSRRWFASLLLANRRILRTKHFTVPKWRTGYRADENDFVKAYIDLDIGERLKSFYEATGIEIAVQGELVGPGIQGNFERREEKEYYIYRVFVLKDPSPLFALPVGMQLPAMARKICKQIGLPYVPVWSEAFPLPSTTKEVLALADGDSAFGAAYREGFVFKSNERDLSFKAISNSFLLKTED